MKTLDRKTMYDLVKLNGLNSEIFKKYNRSYQTLPDFLLYEFLKENGYILDKEDSQDLYEIEEYDDDCDCNCDCDCDDCEDYDDSITISKEDWYTIKALVKTLSTYFN